ncbi:MAG: SPFH/Band 7/PHB domain protein [Rikenellaceae bacterium]|nr:SPFH/Band 7/PHB domain protein [Rikenellaceae bacterium]
MEVLIIPALIAFFVILLVASGLKIVRQSETIVIERLGKYNRTLTSGINIIWPIIDRPRKIITRYSQEDASGRTYVYKRSVSRIDLRETVYDFPRQSVITKDNVVTEINAIIYFQIVDPVKALYEISNLPDAIEKLTQTTLRNVVGEMDLDETLTSRDTINSKLRAVLDDATNKWGVKINRVELQDINPPIEIRGAMEKQMRAERDRRGTILEAEGRKTAIILDAEGSRAAEINKAEGDKQAQILSAEGEAAARIKMAQAEAEARIKIAEAEAAAITKVKEAIESIKGGDPVKYLIAVRYIDTLKDITSGQDNKTVYMPYEATGVLGSVGSIKELFKE